MKDSLYLKVERAYYTSTASAGTVSRNRGRISFCSAITSTRQQSNDGLSSPRVTEPKSRTSVGWYSFAKAGISLRYFTTNSRVTMTPVVTIS